MSSSSSPSQTTTTRHTKVQPPGELAQTINKLLHVEPYSYLFHAFFWSFIFLIICPLVGIYLLSHAFFRWIQNSLFPSNKQMLLSTNDDSLTQQEKEMGVYITGCDTGFGKDLAFALAEKGYTVFPGCLTDVGLKQYEGVSSIIPIKVDVTKDKDTIDAAAIVKKWMNDSSAKRSRYLHAVVNNAGIGIGGLIDWMDISVYQKVMDVNYFGTIRTVKAFLPLLKEQACTKEHTYARIINVVSMAGLVTNAGISTYYGSKHAQEAFTSCLRLELKSFDIDVITVNPSVHETPMNDGLGRQISGIWESLSPELKAEYGSAFFSRYYTFICEEHIKVMWKAENVQEKLVYCVEALHPPPQVLIGSNAMYQSMLFRMLPVAIQVKILERITPLTKAAKMMKK